MKTFKAANSRSSITTYQFVTCLLFGFLIAVIPWESLRGSDFVDKAFYHDYFSFETNRIDYIDLYRPLDFVTNEVLWHFLGKQVVGNLGISAAVYFASITVISVTVYALVLVKGASKWRLFFLFNPLFIDLVASQYRLALALSVLFLIHIFRPRLAWKLLLCAVALFLHTAVALFIVMLGAAFIFAAKFKAHPTEKRRASWIVWPFLTGAIISLSIGPFREILLSYLGDRRAEYVEMASSLLYSSFWILLSLFSNFQSRKFFARYENIFALIILSVVVVNSFTGGYSTRFLAAAYPFLLIYILNLKKGFGLVFTMFLPYNVAQWYFWFNG